jgi:oxalate decarboxylase/phosphoglucose isomerase-like protein (cupin superfamily)
MYKTLSRVKHLRADGWLAELISMNYDDQPFRCVHTYLVSIAPGKARARHYHQSKEEWMAIASGKIDVYFEHVNTGEKARITLDSASPDYALIYIPPYVAHAVVNAGEGEASLVVFSRAPEAGGDTIGYEVSI